MAKVVRIPCKVEADEGEVIIECGAQAVSLSPERARQAGADLLRQAPAAEAHRMAATAAPTTKDRSMRPSPFLQDPRDLLTHHIALAVESPMAELAAMHIRAAEHHAALAKASGLDLAAGRR